MPTTKTVTTDKLFADLETVVRDAEALLQATASQTGERIEQIRARAETSLKQARVRLSEAEEQAIQQVKETADEVDRYVHTNPWQAVGVAAGIGLLLGLLISRR